MSPHRVGVVAGAFNPVTRAHIALAAAARPHVDEVVFAMPRTLPHKDFRGASLDHRIEMLQLSANHRVEITNGGLFIEMARELRKSRPNCDVFFITGRDAAERVVNWDYPEHGDLERMFEEFQLLVAERQGVYQPPDHLRARIHQLALPAHFDDVASSEVRRRLATGEPWEHLVPESIIALIREIYASR